MGGRRFQLAVAVELVAKEIGNDDRAGRDLLDESRQAGLVDLEETDRRRHGAAPAGLVHDRGRHAENQVRPSLVGDGRMALRLEDMSQQRGGRRLAIGSGDHDGSVGQGARQLGEDFWVDPARDIAGERRATAATQAAAQRGGQLAGPERHGSARAQPGAHQAAAGTGRHTHAGYPSPRTASRARSASWRLSNTANKAAPVPLIVSPGTTSRSRSMASSSEGNKRRLAGSRSFPNANSPSRLAGLLAPSPLAGEGRGGGGASAAASASVR